MPRKKRSASPFELMDDDFDDNSSQSSRNGNPPIQRNAANARERARMRVLSSAFGRLKTKLPNIPADTKLSKLDTLRLATMYIKQLKTVVEGGIGGAGAATATNGDIMEGTLNNIGNNATHNYLNLNTGVQSMNWPFGFHHHLSNSSLIRSSPATSLINHNTSNNNWSPNGDNNNEEQLKPLRYEDNYEHNHHQQEQTSSYIQHNTNHNHQPNHWYSETPSPELDSTSSTCLTFENTHLQHQPSEQHHQQQQQQMHSHHQHHHHHHHNLTHLQSDPTTHSSSTFQLQHDFHHHSHHHQQHQPSQLHHLHQNSFVNNSNFQSTSIR
ncbi:histidine-rich glycoprotein-like [Lucilia sericata]|uniref:histidine-rich glycoprotein-like n=1 Tax=Lucilia sericata TaxID=13632 RepID=UPI0018A7FAFC|nr:histidine-rich glycoprotein-like [Lucilia sericata]